MTSGDSTYHPKPGNDPPSASATVGDAPGARHEAYNLLSGAKAETAQTGTQEIKVAGDGYVPAVIPDVQPLSGGKSGSSAPPVVNSTVTLLPQTLGPKVDPEDLGIGYTWQTNPATQFDAWNSALQSVSRYQLLRYPSGHCAEAPFDYLNNYMPECYMGSHGQLTLEYNPQDPQKYPPGPSPEEVISHAPAVSFVLPSSPAIKSEDAQGVPITPEQREQNINGLVKYALEVVSKYSNPDDAAQGKKTVQKYEIGDEWWSMNAGFNSKEVTEQNILRYAELLKKVVPAMKLINPNVQIFASADWQQSWEFTELRKQVGEAVWGQIDGISVHTYCGTEPGKTGPGELPTGAPCDSIPATLDKLRLLTGKDMVYDSQWFVHNQNTDDDYGIKNANYMTLAFQDLAFARVSGAITWPVTDYLPELNFVSPGPDYSQPYASGILFGWLSKYYGGSRAFKTGGDTPAIGGQSPVDGSVTIFVPSLTDSMRKVSIPLAGTGLDNVSFARVLYSDNPNDPMASRVARTEVLPTSLVQGADGSPVLTFSLPPWGIAQVTFKPPVP